MLLVQYVMCLQKLNIRRQYTYFDQVLCFGCHFFTRRPHLFVNVYHVSVEAGRVLSDTKQVADRVNKALLEHQ